MEFEIIMLAIMLQVIVRPSLAVFEAECARASLGRAITNTAALGVVTGGIGGLINFIFAGDAAAEIVALAIMTALRLVAALIASQAFLFAAARALNGRGDFATQTYLAGLVFAPLNALGMLANSVPTLGAFVALALLFYSTLLIALAMRAAHGGRAWHVSNVTLVGWSFVGGWIAWLVISSLPG